jgi:hypothetical protein
VRSASSLAILALLAGDAAADAKTAETAFERGLELMKQNKFEQACVQFRASLDEDFQFGAFYVLAGCEEKRGRLATAWRAYQRLAAEDTNVERRKRSAELAAEIEKRLPKIQIVVTPKPEAVAVLVDGVDVSARLDEPIPVDLGERNIVVNAPGYDTWQNTVLISAEKKTTRIDVAPIKLKIVEPQKREETVYTWHYRAGQVAMIGGGTLVLTGLVCGAVAWGKSSGTEAPGLAGDRDAIADARSARKWGNASTIFTIIGVATVGAGFYLWREGSRTVMVEVGNERASAMLAFGF